MPTSSLKQARTCQKKTPLICPRHPINRLLQFSFHERASQCSAPLDSRRLVAFLSIPRKPQPAAVPSLPGLMRRMVITLGASLIGLCSS